ncbi:MAG TPA: transglutaminase family protein [Polyangiales bacterium]|nr:transglutaminase family protein [Polyangiales bacterium]
MHRLRIEHLTEYRFAAPVQLLPHRLMLRPREGHNLRVLSSRLEIEPLPQLHWQRDPLDNSIAVASFQGPTSSLHILSEVLVEHYDEAPFNFVLEPYAATMPFQYSDLQLLDLTPFRGPSWPLDAAAVAGWIAAQGYGTGSHDTLSVLSSLNRAISNGFRYETREEEGVQSPALTIARASGSCRDYAALFGDACRQLGFASRFVSGYHTSYANETGSGSTHAWAEVFLPGAGWKGFDPTAGVLTGGEHIAVAYAVHPESVPPVAGSYLGAAEPQPSLNVFVRVLAV